MKEELAKRYEPAAFEQRLYDFWEKGEYFTPEVDPERPKFSIVIPPPNVTGRLHIGHALVNTLQDIVVRWKRMSGFNTLWLPGTDHAGIATQMVVERDLNKQGISRHDLGREGFEAKVWEWKESYGHQIIDQLKRLGSSADWTRLRFTLDEGLSRAVRHVFVTLYNDGLIYRSLAMVNWCPHCRTAISDVEVEYHDRNSRLYNIDYPVADSDRKLTVATTRPETMLGDTGIAVHPDDERYKDLIGKEVILPIANRRIRIVADAIDAIDFQLKGQSCEGQIDPRFDRVHCKRRPYAVVRDDPHTQQRGDSACFSGDDHFGDRAPALLRQFESRRLDGARNPIIELAFIEH